MQTTTGKSANLELGEANIEIGADVLELANADALAVALVDSDGTQIDSFGGGTQYTEGDTDSTITGTAIMWEDSDDTLRSVSASKPLPVSVSGVATATNQSTIIGHLDGVEGLLTTIDADTGDIATDVATIAGAVDGTEMQVDVVSLPTVDVGADILTLSAADALVVAIVDGEGNQITSFGGGEGGSTTPNTEYTEGQTDSSITGIAMMWEDTSDTLRAVSASKPLPVNLVMPAAVPVTDNNTTLSVDDGGSTLSVDDGGGSITVDGTVAVSGTVTVDTELPSAAALADNTPNPTAPAVGSFLMVFDGSTWDRVPGNSSVGLLVNTGNNVVHVDDNSTTLSVDDGGGSLTVDGTVAISGSVAVTDGSGSLTVDDGGSSLTVDGTVTVQDGGGSITVDGSVTVSDGGGSLTVDGDVAVSSLPGLAGAAATAANLVSGTASATGTSDTQVIAAQGSGQRIHVTTLVLANTSETDVTVSVKSGSTARMVVPVPAGGGSVVPLPVPLRLGDNEALNFASSGSATTIYCSAVGFKSA